MGEPRRRRRDQGVIVLATTDIDDDAARRRRFGRALADALNDAGINQSELARLLADIQGSRPTPSKVSDWVNGLSKPDAETVFVIEGLLDVGPGQLSQHLGFIPVEARNTIDTVDAIEADPYLSEVERLALLAAYRAYRAAGRKRAR